VKNSEQLANQAPLDDKGVTMDKEAAQNQLRQLAALHPLQAGSLYTTFTDLMLSQQWYTLRLHNLQAAGWVVLFGQKSVDHPIRMVLPMASDSQALTPARLKVLYHELGLIDEDRLPPLVPSSLADAISKDGYVKQAMQDPATSMEASDEEKAQAGHLDKESFYLSMATPDSSVVYYKLSKGINKPHDVPDE